MFCTLMFMHISSFLPHTLFFFSLSLSLSLSLYLSLPLHRMAVPIMDPRVQRPTQTVVEAAHIVKQYAI